MAYEPLEDRRLLAIDFSLIADVNPRPVETSSYSVPDNKMVALGDAAYYTASDGQTLGLWKSDGTPSGTILLKELASTGTAAGPLNYPNGSLLTVAGGQIFFTGYDKAGQGPLWKSDGTIAGTISVPPKFGTFQPVVTDFQVVGGLLYFKNGVDSYSYPPPPTTQWRSNGTQQGTIQIPGSGPTAFDDMAVDLNGISYYRHDDGVHGIELWKRIVASGATSLVKDLTPGSASTTFDALAIVNGALGIFANNQFWVSDGTDAGTVPVNTSIDGSPIKVVPAPDSVGDLFVFTSKAIAEGGTVRSLWKTDLTAAGTAKLADLHSTSITGWPPFSVDEFAETDDRLVFTVFTGGIPTGNYQLWSTDGTVAGTVVLREEVRSFYPFHRLRFPVAAGGQVFFLHWDDRGAEALYKTDGTVAGTSLVKPIVGTYGSNPASFVKLGGKVFFTTYRDNYYPAAGETSIWMTDGTSGNTTPLSINPALGAVVTDHLTRLGDRFLFKGGRSSSDAKPWVSDGTASGTMPLHNTGAPTIDYGDGIVTLGNYAYFLGKDVANGVELWRTDGTAAGTVRLTNWTNFWEGSGYRIEGLAAAGGLLYFSAQTDATAGLWTVDPTTLAVTKIGNGRFQRLFGDASGSAVYYQEALNYGVAGYWRFTPGGSPVQLATTPELDVRKLSFVSFGASPFYFADGIHLYKSGGTAATTLQLDSVLAPTGLSNFGSLAKIDDQLYFAADHPLHGRELWKTDGTAAGTKLVADIADDLGSAPSEITQFGNRVFVAATTRGFGREPWVADLTQSHPLPGDYDGNDQIDGGDILALQRSLGSPALPPGSGADGDGSGAVGAEDLGIIASHFGEPLAVVAQHAADVDAVFAASAASQLAQDARAFRPLRRATRFQ